MSHSLTYEEILERKDKRDFNRDPLARLNKAQTKRLEEAYFAELQWEKEMEAERWLEEQNY